MISWIRIDVDITDDPAIARMAVTLKTGIPAMVGHVVGVLAKFPAHAPDGNVSSVPDVLLEDWAKWKGKQGTFAARYRHELCDEHGVTKAWEKLNGAAIREAKADADRKREERERRRRERENTKQSGRSGGHPPDDLGDVGEKSAVTLRDGGRGVALRATTPLPQPGRTDGSALCPFCEAHVVTAEGVSGRLSGRLVHEPQCRNAEARRVHG